MSWLEAVRVARPAYAELAFQAIYGLRQGNLPPVAGGQTLAARARRRVTQSKLLVSGLLSLIALGGWVGLRPPVQEFLAPFLDRWLYAMAVVGAVLVLELALLWWTGLQVLPTFLTSGTLPFLSTLPIEERTLRRVALLLMLRLFDAPAIACLILTPLAVGAGLSSPLAGLLVVPGVVVCIVLAMALALLTGEFFVRRVQGAHAGPGQSLLRWGYLLLWAIPAFAMYGFLAAAPAFFDLLRSLGGPGFSAGLVALLAVFPMPFGLLPAVAGGLLHPPALVLVVLAVALTADSMGAAVAAVWLRGAPLRLSRQLPLVSLPRAVRPLALAPGALSLAIVRKDLRIASRTPGFAFVVLLPLLEALALGLLTFFARPSPSTAFNLGAAAVSTSALLATFFGPALFAIEVMGYSYVRALPVPARAMVLGKVMLVTLLYLLAAAIVIGFTLARVFSPLTFLAFVAAELPAVVAAALLEFGLLFRRASRRGLPVVNLYTGAWWATVVAIPGVIVAGFPLALYRYLGGTGSLWALPALAIAALVELALVLPLALSSPGRRGG